MTDVSEYRKQVLNAILGIIQPQATVLAAWEGGSAATGQMDQFSDIDFCILAESPILPVLDLVAVSLETFTVTHTWQVVKSGWGDSFTQRFFVLKDSPKHFFVDVGVFDSNNMNLVKDFLEVERHGTPTVFFDKKNLLKPGHTDAAELFRKQNIRLKELKESFPIYQTLVLKELERKQPIDAYAFFLSGLIRPLIEILGMVYRPYKFDFGMRYIHKSFPPEKQKLIEDLFYISHVSELSKKMPLVETAFKEAVQLAENRPSL